MPTEDQAKAQAHVDAGDGVELTATEARGGARKGLVKVLVISILLAVVLLGLVWMATARPSARPQVSAAAQVTALPNGPTPTSTRPKSEAWRQARLGASGEEKCVAFRQVQVHGAALEVADGGTIAARDKPQLDDEMDAARLMLPASVTPLQCGVPLG